MLLDNKMIDKSKKESHYNLSQYMAETSQQESGLDMLAVYK